MRCLNLNHPMIPGLEGLTADAFTQPFSHVLGGLIRRRPLRCPPLNDLGEKPEFKRMAGVTSSLYITERTHPAETKATNEFLDFIVGAVKASASQLARSGMSTTITTLLIS